ncbi:MAG: AAA family ATPase [Candidatus Margulisbacteria bacterium]|nr:AAA family ATPase [Candidatus Margulisiibacteriota bacterium]
MNKIVALGNGNKELEIPDILKGKIKTFRENYKTVDPNVYEAIGITEVAEQVLARLQEHDTANVLLKGLPGTGKTTVMQHVGAMIERGELPGFRVCFIDACDFLHNDGSGTYNDKLNALKEFIEKHPKMIVMVDEAHRWGQRNPAAPTIIFDEMKTFLTSTDSRFVFATTTQEAQKYVEGLPALDRRLKTIVIPERSRLETINILKHIRELFRNDSWLEKSFKYSDLPIRISNNIIRLIYELSRRHLSGANPELSIRVLKTIITKINIQKTAFKRRIASFYKDLLVDINNLFTAIKEKDQQAFDELEPILKKLVKSIIDLEKEEMKSNGNREVDVTEDQVIENVAEMAGKDRNKVDINIMARLAQIEKEMKEEIVGADEPVEQLMSVARQNALGLMDPNRPLFNGVFTGPTGTGKTFTFQLFAEKMGLPEFYVDCNKIMDKYQLSEIVGAPPSFVGYEEGSKLLQFVKNNPSCVVIFDEVEKACPELFEFLMNILDRAKSSTTKEGEVNFNQVYIGFTSNLGAEDVKYVDGVHQYLKSRKARQNEEEIHRSRLECVEKLNILLTKVEEESREKQLEDKNEIVYGLEEKKKLLISILNNRNIERGEYPEYEDILEVNIETRENYPDHMVKVPMRDINQIIEMVKAQEKRIKELSGTEEKESAISDEEKIKNIRQNFFDTLKNKFKDAYTLIENTNAAYLENLLETGDYLPDSFFDIIAPLNDFNEINQLIDDYKEQERDVYNIAHGKLSKRDQETEKVIQDNAKKVKARFSAKFKPEIINRILAGGGITIFNRMSNDMLRETAERIMIRNLKKPQKIERNNDIIVTDEVYEYLKQFHDKTQGGRHMRTLIEDKVRKPFSDALTKLGKNKDLDVLIKLSDDPTLENKILVLISEKEKQELSVSYDNPNEAEDVIQFIIQQLKLLPDYYDAGAKITIEDVRKMMKKKSIIDLGNKQLIEPQGNITLKGMMPETGPTTPVAKIVGATKRRFQSLYDLSEPAMQKIISGEGSFLRTMIYMAQLTAAEQTIKQRGVEDSFHSITDKNKPKSPFLQERDKQLLKDIIPGLNEKALEIKWEVKDNEMRFRIEFHEKFTRSSISGIKYYKKLIERLRAGEKIDSNKEQKDQEAKGIYVSEPFIKNTIELFKDKNEAFMPILDYEIDLNNGSVLWGTFELPETIKQKDWVDLSSISSKTQKVEPFKTVSTQEVPEIDHKKYDKDNMAIFKEIYDYGDQVSNMEDTFKSFSGKLMKLLENTNKEQLTSFLFYMLNGKDFRNTLGLKEEMTNIQVFDVSIRSIASEIPDSLIDELLEEVLKRYLDTYTRSLLWDILTKWVPKPTALMSEFKHKLESDQQNEQKNKLKINENIKILNDVIASIEPVTYSETKPEIELRAAQERITDKQKILEKTNMLQIINNNPYLISLIKGADCEISLTKTGQEYIFSIQGEIKDHLTIPLDKVSNINDEEDIKSLQNNLDKLRNIPKNSTEFKPLVIEIINLLKTITAKDNFLEEIKVKAGIIESFKLLELLLNSVFAHTGVVSSDAGQSVETMPEFSFSNKTFAEQFKNWAEFIKNLDSNDNSKEGDVNSLENLKAKINYLVSTGDRFLSDTMTELICESTSISETNKTFKKWLASSDMVNQLAGKQVINLDTIKSMAEAISAQKREDLQETFLTMLTVFMENLLRGMLKKDPENLDLKPLEKIIDEILKAASGKFFENIKPQIVEILGGVSQMQSKIGELKGKTVAFPEELSYFMGGVRSRGTEVMIIANNLIAGQAVETAQKVADLLVAGLKNNESMPVNESRSNGQTLSFRDFMQKTGGGAGYYMTVEKAGAGKDGQTKVRVEITNGSSSESSWRLSYTGYIAN